MLVVNINRCLSLRTECFKNNDFNIDYLATKLLNDISVEDKLVIATKCVNLCEKFHSYFHFEQSYFHLLLGKLQNSSEQYEAAIFQDPLNHEAKHLLSNLQLNSCVAFTDKLYVRDFQNFSDFLKFAVGSSALKTEYLQGSYWHWYDKYLKSNKLEYLAKTVEKVSAAHKLYHTNAAKIYYNRHLCFKFLGDEILAKNDLLKSQNLDKNVVI